MTLRCICQHLYLFVFILIYVRGISAECQRNGTTLDCSQLDLTRVPANIPVNTTSLNLSVNNITILYNDDFLHLVNLLYLYLSSNPISTTQVNSFSGLTSLLTLELFGHQLNYSVQALPMDVFKPLKSLETLHMRSEMKQFHISGQVLRHLEALTELNIDTTPFMIFDDGFSGLINLNHLILGKIHNYRCGLAAISNQTFEVLSKSPITLLDLNECELTRLDKMSFKPFFKLKTIILTRMGYSTGNFSDVIQTLDVFKHKVMSEIRLPWFSHSSVQYTSTGYPLPLEILSQICVSKLDLSDNNIIFIDFDVLILPPLPPLSGCIKELYLNGNSITGRASKMFIILVKYLSNLEVFDASIQKIFDFNHFESMTTKEPKIQRVSLGFPIFLPPKLKYLNIAGMPKMIGEIGNDVYVLNGANMRYLNISYCGLYDFYHKIFGLENLEVLDLSGNDLSILRPDIFDTFPNLTSLRLSHAFLENYFMDHHGKRLLKPLRKLDILDMSKNNFVFLPYDIFVPLVAIRVIILVNNKLVGIPDVSSFVNLRHIHMSFNALTTIDVQHREMLDRTATINNQFRLSVFGNTFSCACSSGNFLLWLQETNVKLDGRNYSCMDEEGRITTTGSINKQFSYFHRKCSSKYWLNLATVGLSLCFIFIITVFVFVKNKMKFKLVLLRMIGQNVYPRRREEFIYEACMIDTASSYPFVAKFVFPELETKRKIKLNISNRDRDPSRPALTTIAEAIIDSWKIVLILTDEFLESNLSKYIMCQCVSAISMTTPDRVIILVDKGTRISANIDFLLEAVSQGNIIDMDISEPLNEDFWNNLSNKILNEDNNLY